MVKAGTQAFGPLEAMKTTRETSSDVVAEAARRLRGAEYVELHRIECNYQNGVLTLRGNVSRYHLKQRAFHAVAGMGGVARVSNEIDVWLHKDPPEPAV
jgi:osmotically-inducible protein OsmY